MLLEVIHSFYQYNRWANNRVLETSSGLTLEQLFQPLTLHTPCIRDTLVHTMSAEWIWLSRWKGTSPTAMLRAAEYPDLATIQTRWREIDEEMQQFVAQLNPGRLAEVVEYTNTKGVKWTYPLWQMMFHQVNHATQHRSEVAVMLTHFGYSPGELDYIRYLDRSTHII